MKKMRTIDLTLAAMFVAMMAIGSNIASIAPFLSVGGVPITLQTFFAILAGLLLGSRLGTISMTVYALLGLIGVPVFANFSGGLSVLLSPTAGFILSFIIVAFVTGKIAEHFTSLSGFIVASLIGLALNYMVGTNWMYFAYKFWVAPPKGFTFISLKTAWSWMMVFLPKDIVLSVGAALLGHRLERTILSKGQFRGIKRAA